MINPLLPYKAHQHTQLYSWDHGQLSLSKANGKALK